VQACIDADGIVSEFSTLALNSVQPTHVLYDAYKCHCKNHPASNAVFGKALTEMFGPPTRQSTSTSSGTSRPRTYRVPDADAWQRTLNKRLGIKGPK
jgi:hypothetical protein